MPTGRIVKDVVQRIMERTQVPNTYQLGEVCQILVKDNLELRGKGGCWAIVRTVHLVKRKNESIFPLFTSKNSGYISTRVNITPSVSQKILCNFNLCGNSKIGCMLRLQIIRWSH